MQKQDEELPSDSDDGSMLSAVKSSCFAGLIIGGPIFILFAISLMAGRGSVVSQLAEHAIGIYFVLLMLLFVLGMVWGLWLIAKGAYEAEKRTGLVRGFFKSTLAFIWYALLALGALAWVGEVINGGGGDGDIDVDFRTRAR